MFLSDFRSENCAAKILDLDINGSKTTLRKQYDEFYLLKNKNYGITKYSEEFDEY